MAAPVPPAAQALSERLEKEIKEFRAMREEVAKLSTMRQALMTQQNENEIVKKELSLVEPGANVYKLTGPTLLKQDLAEAKGNVDKRLQYIAEESKRLETKFKELDKKQEEKKNRIMEGQQQLQQMQTAALGTAPGKQ